MLSVVVGACIFMVRLQIPIISWLPLSWIAAEGGVVETTHKWCHECFYMFGFYFGPGIIRWASRSASTLLRFIGPCLFVGPVIFSYWRSGCEPYLAFEKDLRSFVHRVHFANAWIQEWLIFAPL